MYIYRLYNKLIIKSTVIYLFVIITTGMELHLTGFNTQFKVKHIVIKYIFGLKC